MYIMLATRKLLVPLLYATSCLSMKSSCSQEGSARHIMAEFNVAGRANEDSYRLYNEAAVSFISCS